MITSNTSEKINQLRAFAAIWVFIFHYYHFILHPFFEPLPSINPFQLMIYHGHLFVYLFFVLSGYLFAQIYKDQFNIKTFFSKRIMRIFPAYYLCLLIHYVFFENIKISAELLLYPFGLNSEIQPNTIGYLWFISRLLICYSCFPIFWWLHKKIALWGMLCVWLGIVIIAVLWNIRTKPQLDVIYASYLLTLSHFLLAVIIGFYSHKVERFKMLFPIATVIIILGILGFHQIIWQNPLAYSDAGIVWYYFLPLPLTLFVFFYSQMTFNTPGFIKAIINQIAGLSYEIYLYHFLVIQFVFLNKIPLFSSSLVGFFILFMITFLIAFIAKYLLDKTGEIFRKVSC